MVVIWMRFDVFNMGLVVIGLSGALELEDKLFLPY